MVRAQIWSRRIERVLCDFEWPDVAAATEPLQTLLELAVTWGRRVDLTAARSEDELVDLYVADAAALCRATSAAPGERWVDVGSGGGAPGIPLGILMPHVDLTLVEPRAKRVAFLRTALGALKRTDIRVLRATSSDLRPAGWDVAMSRATLPPGEWLREGARLAAGVWVLLARADTPSLDGWRLERTLSYSWPLTGVARRACRFIPEEMSPAAVERR